MALEIPEAVSAYTAVRNGNFIDLVAVNEVIPANTAVVVKGNAGMCNFAITSGAAAIEDNALLGTIETIEASTVAAPYTLQTKRDDGGNVVGVVMRKYTGAELSGFKMYMDLPEAQSGATFSFRVPGTTDIIEVVAPGKNNGRVYDLFGRPVENPVKGVYIVDDKKVIF